MNKIIILIIWMKVFNHKELITLLFNKNQQQKWWDKLNNKYKKNSFKLCKLLNNKLNNKLHNKLHNK
jgi:hypothetical protein